MITLKRSLIAQNQKLITAYTRPQVDELLHRLMLSISETQPGIAWQEKFQNVNLVIRRLAYKHPYLVLRQFPTFVSLLQGRQRMGVGEFKSTNQLMFYTQMLGLMDLLRPHIFAKNLTIQDAVSKVIEVFLDLIQSQCVQGTDLAGIVNKLVDFLNHLIAYDSATAFSVLNKHESIFEDLLNEYPNHGGIKFLCTFLKVVNGEDDDSGKGSSIPVVPPICTPWTERQLVLFKQKLAHEHHAEDLIGVLNDVDETSRRRVDILQQFVAELISLQQSEFPEVREKAHVLLLRHCRQQPRDTQLAVESYLNCLQSANHDVALSAAKCLPQLLLLSDDGCEELLEKLFELSISTEPQVAPFLLQAINNLGVDL